MTDNNIAMGLLGQLRPLGPLGPLGLLALVVLAGCSADPDAADGPAPVEETGTPIAFYGAMEAGQEVTRAQSSLNDYSATFTVYGYKNMGYDDETGSYTDLQTVFPGYTVNWIANSAATTVTNTHNWEYVAQKSEQTVKYWDWDAKAYRFFAVAAGGTTEKALDIYEVNKPYETRTATESTLTIPVDCTNDETCQATPYYTTLWFSNGQPGQPQFGDPVQLTFIKPIAKVCFKFIFEDPSILAEDDPTGEKLLDNYSFKPTSGATIAIKGNLIVTYPLTGTGTAATVSIDRLSVSGTDFNALTERDTWYAVLPVTGQGTYTLSVEVAGQPQSCVVPAGYMDWAPGCEYTYIFKVHVDGGVGIDIVQSAFTPWTLEDVKDHEVYNW